MKVLFIGLGGVGQRHLRNIFNLHIKNIKIYAFRKKRKPGEITYDLKYKPNVNLEKKYKINLIESIQKLKKFNPDLTFISTPSSLHIKYALIVARNGSNIFIEKPVSHNLQGIDELINITNKRRLKTYIGFQLRFHPVIVKMKKLVDSNTIGKILSVRSDVCEYMPGFHKYEDYSKSYTSRKNLGGGVVLSQIHEIDYLQWIFGFPFEVYASGGKKGQLKINVEDSVSVLMRTFKKNEEITISLYMDFLQKSSKRSCSVYGTEGRIEADISNAKLTLFKDAKIKKQFKWDNYVRNDLFINQIKKFLKNINKNEISSLDLSEGIKSLNIAIAIKKSMKLNKIIKVKKYE